MRAPRLQSAALLEFCMSDLDESDWASTVQLAGLALLPLSSSAMAAAEAAGEQAGAGSCVFVPTAEEARLFAPRAGHLLLDVALLSQDLTRR